MITKSVHSDLIIEEGPAVAKAAIETNLARISIDLKSYRSQLEKLVDFLTKRWNASK